MRIASNLLHKGFDLPLLDGPLTNNDILHIFDVFSFDELEELFKQRGYPKYIVTDHFERIDHPRLKFHTLPLYASSLVESYKPYQPTVDIDTRYIFNFTFNKKQINRFVCLKLVEFFKLTNYDYTNSGFNQSFDMTPVLEELDSLGDLAPLKGMDRGFILAPSTIPPKFFHTRADMPPDNDRLVVNFQTDWPDHLERIVTHSAVTLLCESNWKQTGSVFTEKTLNSVLGHTFPIWIGGYQQADGWKNLGFDTFDDIIDHSYQHRGTFIEQCYYAFADNLELLTNFEKTAKLRQQLMPRLKQNYELLMDQQLNRYIKQQLDTYPPELKEGIMELCSKVYIKIYNSLTAPIQ